ncbi:MAG: hypothetical protein MPF33_11130 [Candidatus Aramenus sp.]|nr:hypothetical protein [Candidatus Aramenus sp.]
MEDIYTKENPSRRVGKALINPMLDADRLDYLQRDSFYFGVKYGQILLDRIIEVMDIYERGRYVLQMKDRDDLEHFLMARYHMYTAVYNHPVKGIFDAAMAYMIAMMIK